MPKNDTLRDQPAGAATPAAPAPGWVMVPVEPTGVMKDCGAGSLPLAAAKPWAAGDCYRAMLAAAPRPPSEAKQHPDDAAADRFNAAMKEKLAQARAKGRSGWDDSACSQERLSRMLREHVEKGDPRDVANFCMFLWCRGEAIAKPEATAGAVDEAPNDWYVRGVLAANLTCWHRLTGTEADELVALYQSLIGRHQAAAPRAVALQGGA